MFPYKFPKWSSYEIYDDFHKKDTIVLRNDWIRNKVLVAPKYYKPIKQIFTVFDIARARYYRTMRLIIRWSERKGFLKPENGDRICWASIVVWYKAARK